MFEILYGGAWLVPHTYRARASGRRRVVIELTGLPSGTYTVATLRLDEDNGCAFNLWDAWQLPARTRSRSGSNS